VTKKQLEDLENFYLATVLLKYNFREKANCFDEIMIQKIRETRLNKKLSDETKAKLSQIFSGHKNPFYGQKHVKNG